MKRIMQCLFSLPTTHWPMLQRLRLHFMSKRQPDSWSDVWKSVQQFCFNNKKTCFKFMTRATGWAGKLPPSPRHQTSLSRNFISGSLCLFLSGRNILWNLSVQRHLTWYRHVLQFLDVIKMALKPLIEKNARPLTVNSDRLLFHTSFWQDRLDRSLLIFSYDYHNCLLYYGPVLLLLQYPTLCCICPETSLAICPVVYLRTLWLLLFCCCIYSCHHLQSLFSVPWSGPAWYPPLVMLWLAK